MIANLIVLCFMATAGYVTNGIQGIAHFLIVWGCGYWCGRLDGVRHEQRRMMDQWSRAHRELFDVTKKEGSSHYHD